MTDDLVPICEKTAIDLFIDSKRDENKLLMRRSAILALLREYNEFELISDSDIRYEHPGRIIYGAIEIDLADKMYELACFLIDNRTASFSKIRSSVWHKDAPGVPGATKTITDDSIYKMAKRLSARFCEAGIPYTIRKRGDFLTLL